MKKIVFIYLLFIVLVGCSAPSTIKFEDDYPNMKNVEHVYLKTDYTTALDIILNNTGVVVLAFDTRKYSCPFCLEVIPLLNEVALAETWDRIYYLDIYNMRMQMTTEYRLLLGYLDSQTGTLREKNGVKTLIVPDIYFVKDGVIMGHHIATLCDQDDNFILNLDQDQRTELKDIYRHYFSLLK